MSDRGRSTSPKPLQDADRDVDMDAEKADAKPDAKVVIITNLTRNVVEGHLRTIFGFYGQIMKIDLPVYGKSGQNRGKAALEFAAPAEAHKAASHMNGGQVDGAILKVELSDLPVRSRSRSRSPRPRNGRDRARSYSRSISRSRSRTRSRTPPPSRYRSARGAGYTRRGRGGGGRGGRDRDFRRGRGGSRSRSRSPIRRGPGLRRRSPSYSRGGYGRMRRSRSRSYSNFYPPTPIFRARCSLSPSYFMSHVMSKHPSSAPSSSYLSTPYSASSESISFRNNLAKLVSPLKRVRPTVPFWRLAAHRVPTLHLYRSLLKAAPTSHVRAER
ncbi:hypothetical protein PQX77_008076 [Marasmius sp. AFHP31]|nr:hypothetical protein PQX77_008076 [Marasmius sp. AFHP31]